MKLSTRVLMRYPITEILVAVAVVENGKVTIVYPGDFGRSCRAKSTAEYNNGDS